MPRPFAALLILPAVTFAAHAQDAAVSLFASGLENPLYVAQAPNDPSRLFIVERFGIIKIADAATGAINPTPFLNIFSLLPGSFNNGLFSLAFDPNYAANGHFYIHYTMSPAVSVVARYRVSANPDIADPASGVDVLRFPRPMEGHFGGWIGFGPDNLLYIPTGDSGNGVVADPENASQNLDTYRGKVLRIDPSGDDFPTDPARNFRIPPDNPFIGGPGLDEIWAYGLRNPWRSSFDRLTGDLWIGDVGQDVQEEINFQPANTPQAPQAGRNYGWRCVEGTSCTGLSGCTCTAPSLSAPIHTYIHALGCSVNGGYVYRGSAIPSLRGWYVFSDYCSDRVWSLRQSGGVVTDFRDRTLELTPNTGPYGFLVSMGEDAAGELYLCDITEGKVYKIVTAPLPCIADVDDGSGTGTPDGGVTIEDLLFFLARYEEGDIRADVDDGSSTGTRDGGVTIDDLLYFLLRYENGC